MTDRPRRRRRWRSAAAMAAAALLWAGGAEGQGSGALGSATAGGVLSPAKGTLLRDTIPAPSLEGNLLGDPSRREVTVYLPPAYHAEPERRFPVLYLLHNYLVTGRQWTDGYYGGFRLQDAMDTLTLRRAVPQMIVVMPDARTAVGAPYLNSPLTGAWDDFLARDLVSWVDRRYRTVAAPEARGIAGHSAGGHAALKLAFKHPDVFGSVYALSPCCLGLAGLEPLSPLLAALTHLGARDGPACRGDAWFAQLPVLLATLCPSNPRKLRGIAFDMGTEDLFEDLLPGVAALEDTLRELGVPHTFERYRGDHAGRVGRRMASHVLPFFSRTLETGEGASGAGAGRGSDSQPRRHADAAASVPDPAGEARG